MFCGPWWENFTNRSWNAIGVTYLMRQPELTWLDPPTRLRREQAATTRPSINRQRVSQWARCCRGNRVQVAQPPAIYSRREKPSPSPGKTSPETGPAFECNVSVLLLNFSSRLVSLSILSTPLENLLWCISRNTPRLSAVLTILPPLRRSVFSRQLEKWSTKVYSPRAEVYHTPRSKLEAIHISLSTIPSLLSLWHVAS